MVSGNNGLGTAFSVKGAWNSIAINQTGPANTLQGGIKSATGSTTASLNANYVATGKAGNNHTLNIGSSTTGPANPTVTIYASNTGATVNTITDTLNGSGLTYTLGLVGTGNTVTNNVTATGIVTLNEGDGATPGVKGDNNILANTISTTGGAVTASLMISGDSNSLTNNVKATGDVTLNQGITGVIGGTNVVNNQVGQTTRVGSLAATQTIAGTGNTVTNTVDGGGAKTLTQSLASDGNVVNVTMSAGGNQTSNFAADAGSTVDYGLINNGSGTSSDVTLINVVGTTASPTGPAVVRVEQTALAGSATAVLTVDGAGFNLGTLASVSGTPGVSVYQNSSGANLNAYVTAAANNYTAKFVQ